MSDEEVRIVGRMHSKALERAIVFNTEVHNRRLRINIAPIKEFIDQGVVESIEWINSKEQTVDCLNVLG